MDPLVKAPASSSRTCSMVGPTKVAPVDTSANVPSPATCAEAVCLTVSRRVGSTAHAPLTSRTTTSWLGVLPLGSAAGS